MACLIPLPMAVIDTHDRRDTLLVYNTYSPELPGITHDNTAKGGYLNVLTFDEWKRSLLLPMS